MTTHNVEVGDDVQAAADQLRPGDTLHFREGWHYGRLTVPCDEVTISGEDGAILEGTQALDSDTWTLAIDSDGIKSLAGSGTWRTPQAQQPWVLLDAEANMLHRIDSDYVGVMETNGYYYMSAYGALAVPDNARPGPDYGADWWNGIEALWVWNPHNQHLYVRYRDGHKPGTLRYSGGHWDHREPPFAEGSVIYLGSRRDVVIEGLQIRGCVDGIAIRDSARVTIEACEITGNDFGVRVYGACEDIKINHNEFSSGLLGCIARPPIAKTSAENPYPDARLTAYHQYMMWKFWHDESDSTNGSALSIYNGWDESTQTVYRPKNLEFAYNCVWHQAFAVDCFGGDGIDIHHNDVRNNWDMGFQRMVDGGRNIQIHDNECHEAGYCLMRWHASDQEAGDNYVYNNRVSDIDQVSDFILFARRPGAGDAHSQLRISLYHNSFSGGNTVCMMDGMLSMPGFNAINNVVSNGGMTWVAALWPSDIGAVDYNFVTGQSGRSAAALGAPIRKRDGSLFTIRPTHNQQAIGGPIWPSDEIEEEFILPAGHPAKASGIDVSKPFVIDGKTYGRLPGFETGYFTGAAPDRGWINRGDEPPNGGGQMATLEATPDSVMPGATVTVTWTGSTHMQDWIGLYPEPAPDADEFHSDWKYTNCQQILDPNSPTDPVPSGSCSFAMPAESGSYQFRMFSDNSLNRMAVSNPVMVAEEEPADWVKVFIPAWVRAEEVVRVTQVEVPAKKKKK